MGKNVIIKFIAETDLKSAEQELQNLRDRERDIANQMRSMQKDYQKQVYAIQTTVKGRQKQVEAIDKLRQAQEKQIKSLEKEKQTVSTSIEEFVRKINSLNDTITKGATQTPKLTTQLRNLKDELAKMEAEGVSPTSDAFIRTAIEAAKLEDQMGDTQQRIKTLASDTKNLDAAMSVGQGLTGAFTVATNAAALLGGESEELQKAFFKVQSALQLLNGVQMVADTLNKDSVARVVIGTAVQEKFTTSKNADTIATRTNTVAKEANTVATKVGTVATKGFGLALKSLGIGLVISALAYLVTKWDDVKEAINKFLPAGQDVNKLFNKIKSVAVGVGNAVVQYLVMPIKTLGKLFTGDIKGAIREFENGFSFMKNFKEAHNAQEDRNDRNRQNKKEQEAIDREKREIERLKNRGKNVEELIKKNLERQKALNEKTGKDNEEVQRELEDLEDKRIADRRAKTKQSADKARQEQEQRNQEILQAEQELEDSRIRLMSDGWQKQVNAINVEYQRKKEAIKGNSKTEIELRKALEEERLKKVSEITKGNLKNEKIQRKALLEAQKEQSNANIEFLKKESEKILGIVKSRTDKEIKEGKRLVEEKIAQREKEREIVQGAFDLGTELGNIAFDIKKRHLDEELEMIENKYTTDAEEAKKNSNLIHVTDEVMAKKKLEIKRKLAQADKEQAMFNIAINTAQAVIAALASVPPNIPLSIFAGVTGAAQLAVVASKPLPKYAKGRRGGKGEFAWVGEQGPEVMWIPTGASIIPADKSKSITPNILNSYGIEIPQMENKEIQNTGVLIDYDKLGKAVAQNVKIPKYKAPNVSVNVDRDGIVVRDGNSETTYLNQKYSGKWN